MNFHTPALLNEVIAYLDPKPGGLFIDATMGGGGHAFELLKRGARVLGIDQDPDAIENVKKTVSSYPLIEKGLTLVQGNFSKIGKIAKVNGFNQVSGILFDLGISSNQIESAQRGFSFEKSGPLDMRMDPQLGISAADIVNNFEKRRLNEIFKTFGQEKFGRRIAEFICRARQIKPIETTGELAKIIEEATGGVGWQSKHFLAAPKARIFQALRIVVNSELLNLEEALPQTVDLLGSGGRLVIISFHSLEDGIVKRFFKQEKGLKILTLKPIGPQAQEKKVNPRARSAKLRVAEKL